MSRVGRARPVSRSDSCFMWLRSAGRAASGGWWASWTRSRRRSAAADGLFDQVEDAAEVARGTPGGQVQHQAVVGELQELGQDLHRYVVAEDAGVTLAAEAV